jgi:hypothetical protein
MLKLATKAFPVEVEHDGERFTLQMTPITTAEHAHELKSQGAEYKTPEAVGARMEEVLRYVMRHTVDWDGVGDEDGNPIAFSADALDLLCADSDRVLSIYRAWLGTREKRASGN